MSNTKHTLGGVKRKVSSTDECDRLRKIKQCCFTSDEDFVVEQQSEDEQQKNVESDEYFVDGQQSEDEQQIFESDEDFDDKQQSEDEQQKNVESDEDFDDEQQSEDEQRKNVESDEDFDDEQQSEDEQKKNFESDDDFDDEEESEDEQDTKKQFKVQHLTVFDGLKGVKRRVSSIDEYDSLRKIIQKIFESGEDFDYEEQSEDEQQKNVESGKDSDDEQSEDEQDTKKQFNVQHFTAFDGKTKTYRISLLEIDQLDSVQNVFDKIEHLLKQILEVEFDHRTARATLNLEGYLEEYDYETFNIGAKIELHYVEEIDQYLKMAKEKIETQYNDYCIDNDERKLFSFLNLHIHKIAIENNALTPPEKFDNYITKLIFWYSDNDSFRWSILAGLNPGITSRNKLLKKSNDLNMDGINNPVQLDDIPRIERNNKFSLNIYMLKYSFDTKTEEIEGPVYHTKNRKPLHINLLLLHDNEKNRYYHIKDLKNLMDPRSVYSNFCDGCLNFFEEESRLKLHQEKYCLQVKTILPPKTVEFCNHEHSDDVLFVVYADFEAMLPVVDSKPTNTNAKTRNVRRHVPYCYGYYIKCVDDEYSLRKTYYGLDCASVFADNLIEDLVQQFKNYKENHPKKFSIKYVPVYFHNLENYDCHFIIGKSGCNSVLGNLTNYFAMYIKIKSEDIDIRILDSLKFIKDSLSTAVSTLIEEDFIEIKKMCDEDDDLSLLTRKGVFPYNYIQSFEDLERTSLPGKKAFYSDIEDVEISDDDYEHALRVWNHFDCETIKDYSKVYLETDILLLADVFEKLRRFCKQNYGLDPAHYHSLPGFSWDAMLKQTGIKLNLFSDVEMLSFVKKGIRGGYAQCSKRHAVANNKYMPRTYKKNKEESYIMYYDANNLYGYAMSQPLPYGGFEWVDDINYNLPDSSKVGYILEVDLTYPTELHDLHSDLPFCPEKKGVPGAKSEMLVADLTTKHNYIIHHSYLALCEQHGLKIDKIHRVLKFKQKAWLKPYIDFNNSKRLMAVTKYEKNMFKLLNNSIYGYTCRNVEKYQTIKLFDHWGNWRKKKGASNCIEQFDYKDHTICSNEMIAVHVKNTKLTFKDPTYVGFCVLDLAKCHMYKFHYNFMKREFGDKLTLLYTDTDSFIYHIKTHDYYAIIKKHLRIWFDTSNYESDNEFQIPQLNKMKLGYFKDEMEGRIVKEFICLKPKMYVIDDGEKPIKRAVGVPRHVTEKFSVEDYRNCLYKNEPSVIEFKRIKAVGHDLYTQEVRKTGLSTQDLKRYRLANGVDTLPWGHCSVTNISDEDESVA